MSQQPLFTFICQHCDHRFQMPNREFGEARLLVHLKEAHGDELKKAGKGADFVLSQGPQPEPRRKP